MDLHRYDFVVINTSGGKDSLCAQWEVNRLAREQGYPASQVIASHQDLGISEWPGTTELVRKQCEMFGNELRITKRRTKDGQNESILDYAQRRGKWPSSKQRWCTSDFKRDPGSRVVTAITKGMKSSRVLYVMGFRAEESPARSKRKPYVRNKRLTTKSGSRIVDDWLPIHKWTTSQVWDTIKSNYLPYHKAYDLGMPRLSCVFCIFSPKSALVLAGQHNTELLEQYVKVEEEIGHSFKADLSLAEVLEAVQAGKQVEMVEDWTM